MVISIGCAHHTVENSDGFRFVPGQTSGIGVGRCHIWEYVMAGVIYGRCDAQAIELVFRVVPVRVGLGLLDRTTWWKPTAPAVHGTGLVVPLLVRGRM